LNINIVDFVMLCALAFLAWRVAVTEGDWACTLFVGSQLVVFGVLRGGWRLVQNVQALRQAAKDEPKDGQP
jgi:hypothetical protein